MRAESALELDSMVERIRSRRCGIVVDGFFLWQHDRGEIQPWYCTMSGGNPFVLAGVWEVWRRKYKDAVHSCAIISTTANDLIDPVHARMPTILSPNQLDSWLNQDIDDETELLKLCRPYSSDHMELHKVSRAVENSLDDTIDVIQPVL